MRRETITFGEEHEPWATRNVIKLFVFGCVVILIVSLAVVLSHAPELLAVTPVVPAAATPVATHAPTADELHARRAEIQTYWQAILNDDQTMDSYFHAATAALATHDVGTASAALADASTKAETAGAIDVDVQLPTGWTDVRNRTRSAFFSAKASFGNAHQALESPSASATAASRREMAAATVAFDAAVRAARSHYAALGGRARDVAAGPNERAPMDRLLDRIMAH